MGLGTALVWFTRRKADWGFDSGHKLAARTTSPKDSRLAGQKYGYLGDVKLL